ncbi:hypothetical protein [Chitinophaga sp. RAB17]|uniref:hypothetical protein n=1 Tax=Chitinophaga sp. RAB17 TaxID=3233049 RepID=UPI003F924ECB
MKQPIAIVIFLLASLCSCKPKKAIEFKAVIDQKEHEALHIMVSEGGPGVEKLNCQIKKDFKGAYRAIDKEEQAFNQIIKEISALSADGISQGPELKAAAIHFYTLLRDMQLSDREEIAAQEASYDTDPEKIKKAQDRQLQLNEERLKMNSKVREMNDALHKAGEEFNKANDL